MLKPDTLNDGGIIAMDRAYINYDKFEQLSQRGVIYVTKMDKLPAQSHNHKLNYCDEKCGERGQSLH